MASLQELLLISQDELSVDLYRKQPDGSWAVLTASGLDGSLELKSIDYTLQLRELYATALELDKLGRFR